MNLLVVVPVAIAFLLVAEYFDRRAMRKRDEKLIEAARQAGADE